MYLYVYYVLSLLEHVEEGAEEGRMKLALMGLLIVVGRFSTVLQQEFFRIKGLTTAIARGALSFGTLRAAV
jgi:hypothetical protein